MSQVIAGTEHDDSKPLLGFWTYIMTDCVLFASLFAAFAVLRGNTAGGPDGAELFSMPFVLTETLILLTSSFTCGLALLAVHRRDKNKVLLWFGATFLLGLVFLAMEISEFTHLYNEGNSWQRSGFLSAFFILVGTHGLHITAGLIWMGTLMYKLVRQTKTQNMIKKFTMLALFWHFLDIVWIFIFSFVYLAGEIQL